MTPSSLTDTLARLTTLARDHGAVLTTQIQLELIPGGAGLLVFWEPSDGDHDTALPKQALLRFVAGEDGKDVFTSAWCYSGRRYCQCLDEGLSEDQAKRECRQLVTRVDDLIGYLLGHPYRTVPRGFWQAPYNALDTDLTVD